MSNMTLRTYAKEAADILRQSGETDSGYYTLAKARGYTMYERIKGIVLGYKSVHIATVRVQ